MTSIEIVRALLDKNLRLVFWPDHEDWKGPRTPDWLTRTYTIDDYHDGDRAGIMHGVEITPGNYVIDVDLDWSDGIGIAKEFLPPTGFIWGRASKRVSHCLYLTPDLVPPQTYKDIGKDGQTLIEFRSDVHQCMCPPSVWQKGDQREQLAFVVKDEITFITEGCAYLKRRVCLAAIAMILARHLGINGYGHDARLCVAGFLLRAGITPDEVITIGESISPYTNNSEVKDVRVTVESTVTNLQHPHKRVKGGPALARLIGTHGKAVITRINSWLGKDSDFVRNASGVIIAKSQENIRRALELMGHELSYDEFADKPLLDGQPLDDHRSKSLHLAIDTEFKFLPPLDFYNQVIDDAAWNNRFHPVRQYLDGLVWDRVPRINAWLITCAGVEDSPYTRAVSSIMLIAGVRRIRQPGVKFDELPIVESPLQGTEKSSLVQALVPVPAWFSDDLRLNLKAQELIESTLGKWVIEASDLQGKRKADIETLKAMLSRQVDGPARMVYAHRADERPRHFILIGTTNSSQYLNDSTGARRFWPMLITKRCDIEWIKTNRDQLWAEASVRESQGESIRLHESLWPDATKEQEKRREIDPWETPLRTFLIDVEPSGDGKRRVVTNHLWEVLAISLEKRDRYGAMRISEIMARLGFKRTDVREAGSRGTTKGYVECERENERLNESADPESEYEVGTKKTSVDY